MIARTDCSLAEEGTRKAAHLAKAVGAPFLTLHPAEQDRLLMEQLPQVRYIARRIHLRLPPHIQLEDLEHAGVLGLIGALHKYDPTKNVALKSYAKYRVHGAILDSLRELDWSPRPLRKKARQLEDAHQRLRGRLGRAATQSELAAELRIPLRSLHRLLRDLRGLELGTLQGEFFESGRERDRCAYHPAASEEDPYSLCLRSEMRGLLRRAIEDLPPRERQVLALYYHEELTMKEVGVTLGVGEARVSQIHSAALVRLRARMRELLESSPAPTSLAQEPRNPALEDAWRSY
jgi:RNA polymerase sigma factor for flagellar operon FliA